MQEKEIKSRIINLFKKKLHTHANIYTQSYIHTYVCSFVKAQMKLQYNLDYKSPFLFFLPLKSRRQTQGVCLTPFGGYFRPLSVVSLYNVVDRRAPPSATYLDERRSLGLKSGFLRKILAYFLVPKKNFLLGKESSELQFERDIFKINLVFYSEFWQKIAKP